MISIRTSLRAAFLVLLAALPALRASAVSDADMDKAKAIAAKFYVRYADNASGYLDGYTPSSMADLESKITGETDRQLLAQFKSASVASDFQNWDKDQLMEYWGSTFFSNNAANLDQKAAGNGLCKKNIREAIAQMTTSQPAQEPEPQVQEEPVPEPVTREEVILADAMASTEAEIDSLSAENDADLEEYTETEKSGTWVYIMILAILVVVVVVLVVYASKTMKGAPRDDEEEAPKKPEKPSKRAKKEEKSPFAPEEIEEAPVLTPRNPIVEATPMREKYAESLAQKSEEIRTLNRQLAEAEERIAELQRENDDLRERLRRQPPRTEGQRGPFEIYLGRANTKGLFVSADRKPIEGKSVYKLTTHDGIHGSFVVINDPYIEEILLTDPAKWLAGGCYARDIFDTDGYTSIFTETLGEAIFRDGAWHVERKAKIRYE